MSTKVKYCSVPGCTDRWNSRHRFPNPTKYKARFDKWIDIINNNELKLMAPQLVYKSKRICSLHFDRSSYKSNKLLRNDSFPTLQLPNNDTLEFLCEEDAQFIRETSQLNEENGNIFEYLI